MCFTPGLVSCLPCTAAQAFRNSAFVSVCNAFLPSQTFATFLCALAQPFLPLQAMKRPEGKQKRKGSVSKTIHLPPPVMQKRQSVSSSHAVTLNEQLPSPMRTYTRNVRMQNSGFPNPSSVARNILLCEAGFVRARILRVFTSPFHVYQTRSIVFGGSSDASMK